MYLLKRRIVGLQMDEFFCKDGRRITFKLPNIDDASELVELNNSALNEDLDIEPRPFLNNVEATAMLHDLLGKMSKGELLAYLAVVNSRVVALATIMRFSGSSSHVGEFGIGVMKDYRRIGVGKLLLNQMIIASRKASIKILIAKTFKNNTAMRRLLETVGFSEVGDIPKIYFSRGQYVNQIISALELN